jgi:hypothetical protein
VSEGFAPSFRVSFFAVTTESSFQGSIGATVSWFLARAETCPARPRLSSAFVLEICGNVDGGVFRSSGTGLLNPETVSKPWFAFGAGTRLGWRSGDNVELELGLGLTVPVRHYPFTYDDTLGGHNQVNVFEIRPVAAVATAGVGYQFQ